MAFLGWFVHYVLIFVVLAAVGLLGAFIGKKFADKKAAKTADEVTMKE